MEPALFRNVKTSRGFTYRYYFSASTDRSKPTILFVHGFPCSAHDWRKVIPTFQKKGYGIIVPDMLGYGGTDKPTEATMYKHSALCQDLVDILDAHQVQTVVAIGHDWGSSISSKLAILHPERVLAVALNAVGYFPPTPGMDFDKLMEHTKRAVGYELFGYWEFLAEDDSPRIINEHWDSFLCMLYPNDTALWKTDMGPRGKFKEWIEQDKKGPLLSIMSPEDIECATLVRNNGLAGPVNYYRTLVTNVAADDNKSIPPDRYTIHHPVLYVGCTRDTICVFSYAVQPTRQFCKNLTVKEIDTGHWVLIEKPAELAQMLLEWVEGLHL
ncbi:hypothetical protein EIP91_011709 [Steccherinum ochraceum]|uniref:AB hydrolase-1 domain-containing protein n=1 Tax=Steccherinum ochraceum TaxID=92696 RepID=A0A4R0RR12_9APHY|nr:hypothetical protein EIP91_011709 [Steccherinum ochraceum]